MPNWRIASADVAGVALERELGRLDADDHEPLAPVLRVPGLEVGERADAVDAGVGPEVDQHDVAAQPGERQRPVARRVEPVLGAGEGRRGAQLRQVRRRHAREAGALRDAARTSDLVPAHVGEPRLDRVRVVQEGGDVDVRDVLRDPLVEPHVEHRREHDRRGDHHDARASAAPAACDRSAAAGRARAGRRARAPAASARCPARRRARPPTARPLAALTEITAARIGPAHGV